MFLGFFFMTGVWHYTLPQAGLAVTPGPLLVMPTAIVTGRLAARQMGGVLGVAITVGLLGHAGITRADFDSLYALHAGLALLTAVLCLTVSTRPR